MDDVRFSEDQVKPPSDKEDAQMVDETKSKKEEVKKEQKEQKVMPSYPVDRDQFAMHNFVQTHKDQFNQS